MDEVKEPKPPMPDKVKLKKMFSWTDDAVV